MKCMTAFEVGDYILMMHVPWRRLGGKWQPSLPLNYRSDLDFRHNMRIHPDFRS